MKRGDGEDVAANRHEGPVTERHLTGKADEDDHAEHRGRVHGNEGDVVVRERVNGVVEPHDEEPDDDDECRVADEPGARESEEGCHGAIPPSPCDARILRRVW